MSFADTIKGLIFKKPAQPADPRRAPDSVMEGGRRRGEVENPFLAARRTWNEHVGAVVSSRQTWQVVGILSLLIVLAAVGGLIHIGSQSKFVPYVVEVDKLGQAVAVAPAQRAAAVDQRVVHASVASFVSDARLVTPDVALQRKCVFKAYSMLAPNDPATPKMNEWLNGTPDSSPFKRAEKEMVSVEIKTVIPQTPDTWQVEWEETTRSTSGAIINKLRWKANLTLAFNPPTNERQIRVNPIGLFITDLSWSQVL